MEPRTSDVQACHASPWHTASDFTPLKAEALGLGALASKQGSRALLSTYLPRFCTFCNTLLYQGREPLLQKASFFFFFVKFD